MVKSKENHCLKNLSPQKPFIVKAYIEWILHNDLNLKMSVISEGYKTISPNELLDENLLILTISRDTVFDFSMNDGLNLKLKYENNFVNVEFPAELVTEIYIKHEDDTKTSFDLNYFETDLNKYKFNGSESRLRLVV